MNWNKLKEKFPKSEKEIREFKNKTNIDDGMTLIQSFLKTKGFNISLGFINELRDYEKSKI